MKIKISPKGYKIKPDGKEIGSMTIAMKKQGNKNVTYEQLAEYLQKGHAVILAEFKESCNDIKEESIKRIECIALDIDSKENKITMHDMTKELYEKLGIYPIIQYATFSDTDYTRFRLIYKLEQAIDVETYKLLYKALQWKYNKYLDQATSNANRIWQGTNKKVYYSEQNLEIKTSTIIKLITAYEKSLKRKQNKKAEKIKEGYTKYDGKDYIRPEYKKQCCDSILESISLVDFIEKHFGGDFRLINGNYVGRCVLHGGDNKNALVINESKHIYTCFTHCGTGNLYTLAKMVYKEENFSALSFLLADEYNLKINEEWIRRIK